jgi:hypothetical protein
MIRAILRHIRRILAFVAKAPFRLACWLFGTGGAPAEPTADFEEVADDQIKELAEEMDAGPERLTGVNMSLGDRIHEYVCGDQQVRGAFDFTGMPDHVAVALCVLAPHQLVRLAAAGPDICRRWAEGEKTGLVGVPRLRKDWVQSEPIPVPEEEAAAPMMAFA